MEPIDSKIGLGTYQLSKKNTKSVVLSAFEVGYRFIDTAQVYGNESEIGNALAENTVARNNYFIATKIWVSKLSPKKVLSSTIESLKKLKLDFVDLIYIHWPAGKYKPEKTLPALENLVDLGLVKHIGVSNFTPALIDKALQIMKKPIFANQVETHTFLQQHPLRKYLEAKDIKLVNYSPLSRGKIKDTPELLEIAKKHAASPFQVSLAWLMALGDVPIPKSSSLSHLQSNFDSQNLKLDDADIVKIGKIKKHKRLFSPPILAPRW